MIALISGITPPTTGVGYYRWQGRARNAVRDAVRRGIIRPALVCVVCGATRNDAVIVHHHWSYSYENWTDVKPVCRACHEGIHHGHLLDPTTGMMWADPYDPTRKAGRIVRMVAGGV